MPELQPKQVQKELSEGRYWPVYWIHGPERMKSRELLRRIRRALFPEAEGPLGSTLSEEVLDGSEVSSEQVLEAAQSLAMGGGPRFVVVREAHALKDPDVLEALLGPPVKRDELYSVCVFLSKDLDKRKKFSKQLMEKAACIPCEEVPEQDREAWIGYLSKARGMSLPAPVVARLQSVDPWSLEIVDQELEKYAAALEACGTAEAESVLLGALGAKGGTDVFLDAFFARRARETFDCIDGFADRPEQAIPLLGLLAWNVRQLLLTVRAREMGGPGVKLNPYLADKLRRWSSNWTLEEVIRLQGALADLDFEIKQTPKLPIGMWSTLAARFTR